jgi:hypothetical protein
MGSLVEKLILAIGYKTPTLEVLFKTPSYTIFAYAAIIDQYVERFEHLTCRVYILF